MSSKEVRQADVGNTKAAPISKDAVTLKIALLHPSEINFRDVNAPPERLRYAKVEAKP